MNKKIILILLMIIVALNSHSALCREDTLSLTLENCVYMAIDTHPQIKGADESIIAAEAMKDQALSSFYPQVSINGRYFRTNSGSFLYTGEGGAMVVKTENQNHAVSFQITQRIFDTFRTWNGYEYSLCQIEKAKYSLEKVKRDLALNVISTYFEVLKKNSLLELGGTLKEQALKHLDKAKANYEAGISPEADIISASVNLTEAEVNLIERDSDFKEELAALKQIAGIERTEEIKMDESFYSLSEPLLEDSINSALLYRPELKVFQAEIKAREEEVDLLELDKLPQFTVDAGFNFDLTRDPSVPENSYSLTAQLKIPVFDGFRADAKIEEAAANKSIVESELINMKKEITLEVERAYYELKSLLAKLNLTDHQVDLAKKKLEIAEGRYDAGVGPFQEILDARVDFSRAMTERIYARYDYQIALFSFKKAIGVELL